MNPARFFLNFKPETFICANFENHEAVVICYLFTEIASPSQFTFALLQQVFELPRIVLSRYLFILQTLLNCRAVALKT